MKAKKILFSILFLILIICIGNSVYATTISFSNESPQVGDSVKITVSVPNVHTADVTAVVSGAGTSGQIKVVGGDMMGNKTTLSNSITVKPTSAGTITVSITSSSNAVADGQYVNVAASRSITVSTPPPPPVVDPEPNKPSAPTTPTDPTTPTTPTKSSNAKLKNLGIRPNDFSGFRANTKRYEVTVPNNVSQVEVYAAAQDAKATVTGTGVKKLTEGSNNLSVVVTAEDGSKETYTIIVTRKVEEGEITPNTDDNAIDENAENDITSGLSKLEVTGLTFTPEFDTNEYKYTIEGKLEDFKSVEEFKKLISTEANFEGAKIEITSEEEEFKVGRNKILITVKDSDGREIAIYTIVLKLTEKEDTMVGKVEENKDIKEEKNNIEWNKIIVISAIVLMAIYSIVVSIIAYKQREILELNGLVEGKEDDDENYNPFEEIKNKQEITEESEEEIRKRKIDEFLRGRESKH